MIDPPFWTRRRIAMYLVLLPLLCIPLYFHIQECRRVHPLWYCVFR